MVLLNCQIIVSNNKICKHILITNYEGNIRNQYYLYGELFDVTHTDLTICVKDSWFRKNIIQKH